MTSVAMVTTVDPRTEPGPDTRPRRALDVRRTPAERAFLGFTRGSALVVLGVIALVGLFLAIKALPAIRVAKFSFLTTQAWQPDIHHFGIAGIITGTVLVALVAVLIAIPVALGLSLYISEVAPAPIRRTLVSLVDLMAAVPSIVYGLWALEFLQGRVIGVSRWISTWFGWLPVFRVNGADPSNPVQSGTLYSASTFIVGIAVSLMVILEMLAHPLLGHARVLHPGAPRGAGGRLCAGRHPVGHDPLGRTPLRQGGHHRGDDARSGPRPG